MYEVTMINEFGKEFKYYFREKENAEQWKGRMDTIFKEVDIKMSIFLKTLIIED